MMGIDPVLLRASTRAVLDHAWDAGRFRADDVMASRGLTRSTTLAGLDALVGVGLVREVSQAARTGQGRPARLFELNPDATLIIGMDAGAHRFTTIITDMSGAVLTTSHLVTATIVDPLPERQQRQASALQAIDKALASITRTREDVLAVCVGIPAPVNIEGLSPTDENGFWPRMNADLATMLAQHFPIVRIENDALLAARAEASHGQARGLANFVATLAGRRLGSGVMLDNRLVRGTHGGVGEMEALRHVEDVGGAWGFGHLIEQWIGRHLDQGAIPPHHPWHSLPHTATLLDTAALLSAPDPDDVLLAALTTDMATILTRICSTLARFYDPDIIIICGDVTESLTDVIARANTHLPQELDLPAPRIVASRLGHDVVALGAAAAARGALQESIIELVTTH